MKNLLDLLLYALGLRLTAFAMGLITDKKIQQELMSAWTDRTRHLS